MTKDSCEASSRTSVVEPIRFVGIGFGIVLLNVSFVGVNCSQHGLELPAVAFPAVVLIKNLVDVLWGFH